ncbi:hypothetical protein ABB37_09316 [Leptomonas pyrrhocoris]|uniref:PH-like domain-containing protein n=1 Tax=Leptomonas pyrrhocoris TaxID=157538 RepID=A0A0M9FR99_LEPPY|nr:hypothetical protein ABB37_09316 [Leptomonas pyrrhocoris]KPA74329.1 hypothetical protein ABB37_09316 [Leptomonas pyrrhocoris]|eukprot:XP_015652768.1 hypothetical protein ABB37_09316 [Leptomonas pyrrhocoris]
MPQSEPSVSDSISYLQNFLNTSAAVPDEPATRPALPPSRPPSSLPAAFLPSTLHSDPLSLPRRSPPSTISVLSHRSSVQHSAIDGDNVAAPNSAYAAAATVPSPFGTLLQAKRSTLLDTPRASQTPRTVETSLLFSAGRKPIHLTSGRAPRTADGASKLSDTFTSQGNASASVAGSSGMFRYGSGSTRRTGDGWRNPYTASQRPSTPRNGDRQRTTPLWGQSPSPRVGEQLPWRRGSVPPSTHQGSSLLWGWGHENGGHGGATSPSLPLYEAPLSSSGDRPRGNRHPDNEINQATYRTSAPPMSSGSAARQSRESAYEEVGERDPPARSQMQEGAGRRRQPPLPPPSAARPSPTPRTVEPVTLTTCHNADEHAANMRRIAHYLKDYYAREADEGERGVESLTAEDVAGLAQCFYIDLYRTVRQARRSAGLETSSFAAEDPTANVTAGAETPPPPPPPRKEEGRYGRARRGISAPPSESEEGDAAGNESDNAGEERVEEREREIRSPTPPPQFANARSTPPKTSPERTTYAPPPPQGPARLSNSVNTSTSSVSGRQQRQRTAPTSRQPPYQHTSLLSSPEEELLSSAAATTRLAPNQQLAYSGGGTHPVQIITARVPAFRNDDALSDPQGRTQSSQRPHSVPGRSSSSAASSFSVGSGVPRAPPPPPSYTYHRNGHRSDLPQGERTADAASEFALASSPSPPYRHSNFALPPYLPPNLQHPPRAPSNATSPYTRPTTPPGIIKGSLSNSRLSKRPTRDGGGQHVQMRPHFQGDSSSSSSSSSNGDEACDEGASYTAEGSENGSAAGLRRPSRRPAPAEPSSGIVKRPLKELMPLLRSHGTLLVKHIRGNRRPHLRLCQILDCVDVYKGSEVLMPHFTWAAADDVYRHDKRPRAKKTKKGVPLPTGLSLSQEEVPFETALNLTQLAAVYVGAGRGIAAEYMGLFHRRKRDGAVVDHRRRPVADGMCVVFVFASRPVAVTFLREADRQVWVGAMMSVVERNRTLST